MSHAKDQGKNAKSDVATVDAKGSTTASSKDTGVTLATDPQHPYTLAIDIGGTGLKASVLDKTGAMVADRVRVPTKYPMAPTGESGMVPTLVKLVSSLPEAERVSAGFPGMVRKGVVLSAPHFVTEHGPGSAVDPALAAAWASFDLAGALSAALGKPTKVANDADVQGAAVMEGQGLEFVITLGTGFGTAMFLDGQLLPHLEIAHQPFRKGETYNDQIGEAARKHVGEERWNHRVRKAIVELDGMLFFDHLYIGGGNARRVSRDGLGDLLDRITIVDNSAGILGGIKLWEGNHLGV
jgi:polyphosphate glucokinase